MSTTNNPKTENLVGGPAAHIAGERNKPKSRGQRTWQAFVRALKAHDMAAIHWCLSSDAVMDWLVVGANHYVIRGPSFYAGHYDILEYAGRCHAIVAQKFLDAVHPKMHSWWSKPTPLDHPRRRELEKARAEPVEAWQGLCGWVGRGLCMAALGARPDQQAEAFGRISEFLAFEPSMGSVVANLIISAIERPMDGVRISTETEAIPMMEACVRGQADWIAVHGGRLLWVAVRRGWIGVMLEWLVHQGADIRSAMVHEHAAVIESARQAGVRLGAVEKAVRDVQMRKSWEGQWSDGHAFMTLALGKDLSLAQGEVATKALAAQDLLVRIDKAAMHHEIDPASVLLRPAGVEVAGLEQKPEKVVARRM